MNFEDEKDYIMRIIKEIFLQRNNYSKEEVLDGINQIMQEAHPGVGELGRAKTYHVHDAGNEIPKGMLLFPQSFLSYGLGKAKQMNVAAIALNVHFGVRSDTKHSMYKQC